MVTYGDTDGSGMDGGQWSPAQCPPPTGHPQHCSALLSTVNIIVCIPKKFSTRREVARLAKATVWSARQATSRLRLRSAWQLLNEQYYCWAVDSSHRPLLYKTFLLHCSVSVLSWFWCINCGVDVSWCTHSSLVLILNPLLCSFRGSICRSNKPGWIFVLNGFTSSLNFMTCYLNTSLCSLVWFCWMHLSE